MCMITVAVVGAAVCTANQFIDLTSFRSMLLRNVELFHFPFSLNFVPVFVLLKRTHRILQKLTLLRVRH